MTTRRVSEQVRAQLFRESDATKIHHVEVKVILNEFRPDENPSDVKYSVHHHEIGPLPPLAEGLDYVLSYTCWAGQVVEKGRAEGGHYLAGR
jgi:hypothetical protein